MRLSTNVWERKGSSTMTRGVFYLVMSVVLAWGFGLTSFIAGLTAGWHPGIFMLLIVGLGIPFLGIYLSVSSENPVISFAGFNLVVIGLAAILGPALAMMEVKHPGVVERAAALTAAVSIAMGLSGLLFPQFYSRIGGLLYGALIALVVVSFARLFIPAFQGVGVIDYFSAGLFSLYIGYDMYKASTVPATLDNAIDSCVELFLSIMNLFLSLTSILGDDWPE